MKKQKSKFRKKGILLILIFIIIFTLLNLFYIYNIQKKEFVYRQELEWEKYKNTLPNNTLEYAFFGDSQAMSNSNPQFINNSFNFASSGESYIETYYKIKKLLEKDTVKINHFILEIDLQTFSDNMRSEQELFEEGMYYHKFVSLNEMSKLKHEGIIPIALNVYCPVIGKGLILTNHLILKPKLNPVILGWNNLTNNFSIEPRTEIASSRYNVHFSKNPNLLENKSLSYFKEILKIAKTNNITIIFIVYPVSYEYDIEINKHNLSKNRFYDALFKEIDKEIKDYFILDYYYIFKENPEFFDDPDHLNYIGSTVFSRQVNEDLINISINKKFQNT